MCLPGLIDCHTHVTMLLEKDWRFRWTQKSAPYVALRATTYVRDMLEGGFMLCRNVGAAEFVDVALRDAIEQGHIVGPRLFVAAHGGIVAKRGQGRRQDCLRDRCRRPSTW